jgi:acetyl-CoA acetyltransferase
MLGYRAMLKRLTAAKNHQHSVNNPYSQFRNSMTKEEVLADRKVAGEVRAVDR